MYHHYGRTMLALVMITTGAVLFARIYRDSRIIALFWLIPMVIAILPPLEFLVRTHLLGSGYIETLGAATLLSVNAPYNHAGILEWFGL